MPSKLQRHFAEVGTVLDETLKELKFHCEKPEVIKAMASIPASAGKGRGALEMVMDDAMKHFAYVMKDVGFPKIPRQPLEKMMAVRDPWAPQGPISTKLELESLMMEEAVRGSDKPRLPDFALLMPHLPLETAQAIEVGVSVLTQQSLRLMHDENYLSAVENHQSVVDETNKRLTAYSKAFLKAGPNPGGPASRDKERDEHAKKGIIVHYAEDIPDVDGEMGKLVGMAEPKEQIKLIRARVDYKTALAGAGLLKGDKPSMDHYIFRGPPGTGKTTFARMIGKIYKDAGLLKSGHVVDSSRVSLVAGYVGQTAIKTQETVKAALDGVLFVDEAYSLFGEGNDFGKEAVEVILREMEVHKGNLIVVFAGYPDKMDQLIRSNPGLTRRFKNTITFSDFTMPELMTIFDKNLEARNLRADDLVRSEVEKLLKSLKSIKGSDFGNAGTVENIIDLACDYHSLAMGENGTTAQVKALNDQKQPIPEDLQDKMLRITLADVQKVASRSEIDHRRDGPKIGFQAQLPPPRVA